MLMSMLNFNIWKVATVEDRDAKKSIVNVIRLELNVENSVSVRVARIAKKIKFLINEENHGLFIH